MSIMAVKNFFLSDRKSIETPKFVRVPESFVRSVLRRSLRVKRTKQFNVNDREKRKSGNLCVLLFKKLFKFKRV